MFERLAQSDCLSSLFLEIYNFVNFQKQQSRGVLRKRCSGHMQQIYIVVVLAGNKAKHLSSANHATYTIHHHHHHHHHHSTSNVFSELFCKAYFFQGQQHGRIFLRVFFITRNNLSKLVNLIPHKWLLPFRKPHLCIGKILLENIEICET